MILARKLKLVIWDTMGCMQSFYRPRRSYRAALVPTKKSPYAPTTTGNDVVGR